MKDRDDHPAAALRLRALTVNWLLDFAEIDDLPVIAPDADMGALDRARYERRLGLVSGALSVGRFIHDFADLGAADVGERLLDEAYLGAIVRSPQPETPTDDPEEATDSSNEPEARFQRLLEAIGLEAGEVLVLSGSPDVSWHFANWGAAVPEVRRHPGRPDFSRYGLAIIGRGQAGHKDFEPWTQQIKSYDKHRGPTMITTPSSNVSGILEYLWTQRESIRRYVDVWRGEVG